MCSEPYTKEIPKEIPKEKSYWEVQNTCQLLTFLPASTRYHLLSLVGLGLLFFYEQHRDYWRKSCAVDLQDGAAPCGSLQQPLTEHSTHKLGTILQHLVYVMGE